MVAGPFISDKVMRRLAGRKGKEGREVVRREVRKCAGRCVR